MNAANNEKSPPVVIVVAIVTALSLIGDSMLYIALPIYFREAGLDSIWQVGIILSINRFIRLPLNPIIGWVYHKVSLRTGIITAIILTIISTCGYGIAQSFIIWIILRCLWGLAWSLLRIGGLSTVVYYSTNINRGKTMGMFNGIYRLGSLVGMMLGGIFVPIFGLQAVSLFFGILALFGVPLIIKTVTSKNIDKEQENNSANKKQSFLVQLLAKNTLLVILSGFLITMLFQGVFTSTLSSVIEYHYGEEIRLLGIIVTVTALSGMIQAARWAWEPFLARKIGKWSDGVNGRVPLYICSLLFGSVTFGLMAYQSPIGLWITITLFVMLSATSLTTLTDTLASDIAKSSSVVSFITVYSITQDLGAAIGPLIAFFIISFQYGFTIIYVGGAAIFLIISILWFILWINTSGKSRTLRVRHQ